MLEELRVENLLLIERAELRLGPGLNVLTGETGAGKTVLAHALDLLLGGKPRSGIVRPGASEAYVEGVFAYPDELRELIGDRLPDDAEEVVLARRVSAEGRTRAYLGGRSATAADLRDVGGALLSFYGQHEHRKLMLASAQLEILDGFCGEAHAARLAAFGAAYARERELRGALEELEARAGARDRELDLLEWELQEIDDARTRARTRRRRWPPSASGCATSSRCSPPPRAGWRRWRATRAPPWPSRAPRGRWSRCAAWTPTWTRWPTAWPRSRVEADDLATELRALRRGRRGHAGRGSTRSRSAWRCWTA